MYTFRSTVDSNRALARQDIGRDLSVLARER